jgi:hypothetical protein
VLNHKQSGISECTSQLKNNDHKTDILIFEFLPIFRTIIGCNNNPTVFDCFIRPPQISEFWGTHWSISFCSCQELLGILLRRAYFEI